VDRYDAVHPRTPLKGSQYYLANKRGLAIALGDELRLYVDNEGVVHFLLGESPKDTRANAVVQFGYSATSTSDAMAPAPVASLARKRVVSLGCGWLHCCCVLESGKAIAFGSNEFGQLGTGNELKSPEPVLCALDYEYSDVRLTAVSCGSYFTCTLDDKGNLYTWGRYQASNWPTKFAETWVNGTRGKKDTPDKKVGIEGEVVTKVAAGESHTVVYCDLSKTLYSWGYNEQWQLGWGQHDVDKNGQQKPRAIQELPKNFAFPVKSLSCGGQHSCVVDANGLLFAWGSNYEGQIGHVVRNCFGAPEAVTSCEHENCKLVQCGRYATLAITEDGNAFFWGSLSGSSSPQQNGAPGQEGGDQKDAPSSDNLPSLVPSSGGGGAQRLLAGAAKQLVGTGIKFGAVGEAHGMLQTRTDDLRGWGYNAYGQALGKVDNNTDVIEDSRPVDLPPDLFHPKQHKLIDLAVAGGTTTLLLSPPAPSPAE